MDRSGPGQGVDRDRNADGRPEQRRPRDRTGRPLPYDSDEVHLAQDWEHATVEEALATGRRLWDEQRFFEAHECLEDVWHHAVDDDRDFWQGVIQIAVACVHHQRGNLTGMTATLAKALRRLGPYTDRHHGVDVVRLRAFADDVIAAPPSRSADLVYPSFPAVDGGPWFVRDAGPHPLPAADPWEQAAAARRAGQRP